MAIALALAGVADANTAANKGNAYATDGVLYVPVIDLAFGDGPEPELMRVYANGGAAGMFGAGWGSPIETYVEPTGDGTLLLHVHGNGVVQRFAADGHPTREDIAAEVDAILAAAPPRPGDAAIERGRLHRDVAYRADRWRALRAKGLVPAPAPPAIGATFADEHLATLARTPDGYRWRHGEGTMLFDATGRFARSLDDRHSLVAARDARGRIASLEDGAHRRIAFTYANDRVAAATTSDGKALAYRYDAAGQLVHARDADGDDYDYSYDAAGRHELVAIRYRDGARLEVGYLAPREGGGVAVVADGPSATVYTYLVDPRDDRHREAGVEIVGEHGDVASRTRIAAWIGERASGEAFVARRAITANGETVDTTYDPRCGGPARIARGRGATTYTYDASCRLESKDEGTPPETIRTKFQYDALARVVGATTGAHVAAVTYDAAGRIATGTLDGVTLRFGYDANGRLRELAADGGGTLDLDRPANDTVAATYKRLVETLRK